MTTAQTPDLLPCPFCGGGETIVQEGSKPFPRLKYRQPTSAAVMHRCTPSEDGLAHTVSLVGQDRASAIAAWNQRAELEARKPLPLSYRAGAMASSIDGGATVSLHFNDAAEAEAWFVAITDQYDTGLVDKSPNLQEPLVDKTANLQDRPVSLIASREVVADGPVHVTRLHLTEEGRAGLTSKATGPLPGITGGSS